MRQPVGPAAAAPRPRGGLHRDIMPPPPGELLHQPAAQRDQRARVVEGQHAGDVRGGDLADASGRRRQSGSTPHDSPRARNSATSTANSAGWVTSIRSSAGGVRSPQQHVRQRPVDERVERLRALASSALRRTPARCRSSSRPMPSPWLPWPGKTNDGVRRAAGDRLGRRRWPCGPRRAPRSPRQQFVPVGGDDHRAVLERGAGGGQGVADVGDVEAPGGRAGARAAARPARAAPPRSWRTATPGRAARRRVAVGRRRPGGRRRGPVRGRGPARG